MGSYNMNSYLLEYFKKNYSNSKKDIFAVFIEKCQKMIKQNSFVSMITQHAFMFLSSFIKLRKKLLSNDIVNMVHLGARAFEEIGGEVVQTTSFILRNSVIENYAANYVRLVGYKSQISKEKEFLSKNNIYVSKKNNFSKIPGSPIAYWANENAINAFVQGKKLSLIADVKMGLGTADNDKFLRFWYEVDCNKCGFNIKDSLTAKNSRMKWFSYNKGGSFRKWYGNQEYLVNWENDGNELKNFKSSYIRNPSYYFKKSLSWSKVSTGNIAFRYFPQGFLFDVAGCSIFFKEDKDMFYLSGFLNSKVCNSILSFISPTLNYEVGHIASLPIIHSGKYEDKVKQLVKKNIKISKDDWDSFETSWNFKIESINKI